MTARSNWAFASPCSAALRTRDKVAASDTFFTAFRLCSHQAIEAPDTATMHTRGTLILANDVIAPTEAWRFPKKECYHLKWYLQSRGVVAPLCSGILTSHVSLLGTPISLMGNLRIYGSNESSGNARR